ncbi:hypothetical protein BVG19_g5187 [[Candida] boidinii]|nr:hypothetical protein BVG19_g5187 [[Candida] boidinii]OWB52623.1 hypothetical protein B5S27_g4200 [[Candida] boidinii]OWB84978.1 hypothetical protein B5S33_g3635 [[Candida] boidinii]
MKLLKAVSSIIGKVQSRSIAKDPTLQRQLSTLLLILQLHDTSKASVNKLYRYFRLFQLSKEGKLITNKGLYRRDYIRLSSQNNSDSPNTHSKNHLQPNGNNTNTSRSPSPELEEPNKITLIGMDNWHNVMCYMDSLIVALFYSTSVFDFLLDEFLSDDLSDDLKEKLADLKILLRFIVNLMRAGEYIPVYMMKQLCLCFTSVGCDLTMSNAQQDALQMFEFIAECLSLPLLTIKLDIIHSGKMNLNDDLRLIEERELLISIPNDPVSSPQAEALTLSDSKATTIGDSNTESENNKQSSTDTSNSSSKTTILPPIASTSISKSIDTKSNDSNATNNNDNTSYITKTTALAPLQKSGNSTKIDSSITPSSSPIVEVNKNNVNSKFVDEIINSNSVSPSASIVHQDPASIPMPISKEINTQPIKAQVANRDDKDNKSQEPQKDNTPNEHHHHHHNHSRESELPPLTLEECLNEYFNNSITVKRHLERRRTIDRPDIQPSVKEDHEAEYDEYEKMGILSKTADSQIAELNPFEESIRTTTTETTITTSSSSDLSDTSEEKEIPTLTPVPSTSFGTVTRGSISKLSDIIEASRTRSSTIVSFLNNASISHPASLTRRTSSFSNAEVTLPAWMFLQLLPYYSDPKVKLKPENHEEPYRRRISRIKTIDSADKQSFEKATRKSEEFNNLSLFELRYHNKRPVVPICLKRYVWNEKGQCDKINRKVIIPSIIKYPYFISEDRSSKRGFVNFERSTDNIAPFGSFMLVLESCVCHRGRNVNSGHYVSLTRKYPFSKKRNLTHREESEPWLLFNDVFAKGKKVTEMTFEKALETEDPYILFYKIVDLNDKEETISEYGTTINGGSNYGNSIHEDTETLAQGAAKIILPNGSKEKFWADSDSSAPNSALIAARKGSLVSQISSLSLRSSIGAQQQVFSQISTTANDKDPMASDSEKASQSTINHVSFTDDINIKAKTNTDNIVSETDNKAKNEPSTISVTDPNGIEMTTSLTHTSIRSHLGFKSSKARDKDASDEFSKQTAMEILETISPLDPHYIDPKDMFYWYAIDENGFYVNETRSFLQNSNSNTALSSNRNSGIYASNGDFIEENLGSTDNDSTDFLSVDNNILEKINSRLFASKRTANSLMKVKTNDSANVQLSKIKSPGFDGLLNSSSNSKTHLPESTLSGSTQHGTEHITSNSNIKESGIKYSKSKHSGLLSVQSHSSKPDEKSSSFPRRVQSMRISRPKSTLISDDTNSKSTTTSTNSRFSVISPQTSKPRSTVPTGNPPALNPKKIPASASNFGNLESPVSKIPQKKHKFKDIFKKMLS